MGSGDDVQFSIVCLSSQEWRAPLPTNRQQIMTRAAKRGHHVLFVETGDFVGKQLWQLLRGPARSSLRRRLLGGERVAPGITVRRALNLLPWGQKYQASNRVNGALSRLVVRRAARGLPRPVVAWLYDPRATWAIGGVGESIAVYDCVDDYAHQTTGPRNRGLVAHADAQAAAQADIVFTTTRSLHARHLAVNHDTYLVGNVGDFSHFSQAATREVARDDLRRLPRPVLGFAGNLLSGKVDVGRLEAAAAGYPEGTLLVAGPVDDELRRPLEQLARRPNVTWLGAVPYDELPAVVAAFDVGLIPYESNEYTSNVFPLKLFEYLAAGKPVVATGLPELEGMEPDVVVVRPGDGLVDALKEALARTSPEDVRRRQELAARNTWDTRTARLMELTTRKLAAPSGAAETYE